MIGRGINNCKRLLVISLIPRTGELDTSYELTVKFIRREKRPALNYILASNGKMVIYGFNDGKNELFMGKLIRIIENCFPAKGTLIIIA